MRVFIVTLVMCLTMSQAVWAQTQNQIELNDLLDTPVFESALDYLAIPMFEDCKERPLRPPAYHACRDSEQIYAKALAEAKTKNQPLMVVFGFDSCPHCRVLDKQVFNQKNPMRNADIVKYLSKPAINTYVLGGRPLKISLVKIHAHTQHGLKLAEKIGVIDMLKIQGEARLRSPMIVFINPHSGHIFSDEEYCDWGAEFAAGIEGVGMVQTGVPYVERKRCM